MKLYRIGALALGIACSGLGMWGAYEFALKLEGGSISYLVLAAPVIALAAAMIPPLAEATWRRRQRVKALLWWATLVPAGAVVFFAAAERVHGAKAGAAAEREAFNRQAGRELVALTKAETDFATAQAAANRARALPEKQCGPNCRATLEAERTARANLDAAKASALKAEKQQQSESPLQAPAWLLPLALDAVAFMAIWTALAREPVSPVQPESIKRKAKRRPKPKQQAARPALKAAAGNDNNVVPFPAA